MADVEMTDAGAAPKVKTSKAGPSGGEAGEKKRFEVKKVTSPHYERVEQRLMKSIVERGGALGVGYRCRQLRHLPQPHHGLVYRLSGESGFGDE